MGATALLPAPIDLSCELAGRSFRLDKEDPLTAGPKQRFYGEQRCSCSGHGPEAVAEQSEEQQNFEKLIDQLVPLLLQLLADPSWPAAAWALLGEFVREVSDHEPGDGGLHGANNDGLHPAPDGRPGIQAVATGSNRIGLLRVK